MINWEEQWRQHAPHFHQGKVHLSIGGKTVYLQPGPGFGDLSHPTTQLILRMMQPHVKGKTVIDIGSGSGILSLAAAALGAKKVIGIDIDPEALHHARENAQLNGLKVQFLLPEQLRLPKSPLIVLMNMIISEQIEAWQAITHNSNSLFGKAFTSGILAEQKSQYLSLIEKWGWHVNQIEQEEKWLGFSTYFERELQKS